MSRRISAMYLFRALGQPWRLGWLDPGGELMHQATHSVLLIWERFSPVHVVQSSSVTLPHALRDVGRDE